MSEDPTQDYLDSEEILDHIQSIRDVSLSKQEQEGLKQILKLEIVHKVMAVVFHQNRNTAAELLGMNNLSTPEGIAQALKLQGAAKGAMNVLNTFFSLANGEDEENFMALDPEVPHE